MEEKLQPDGLSETLTKKICKICEEEIDICLFPMDICNECAFDIFDETGSRIDGIDSQIRQVYGIGDLAKLDQVPFFKCQCKSNDVLSIDYFTPPSIKHDHYDLCICGICRSCMGYRVDKIDGVAVPFNIKNRPPHVGINLNVFNNKIDDNKRTMEYFI